MKPLLCKHAQSPLAASEYTYLPFIPLGVTYGVEQQVLLESDDGVEGPIPIDPRFPFGSSVQTVLYVSTAG